MTRCDLVFQVAVCLLRGQVVTGGGFTAETVPGFDGGRFSTRKQSSDYAVSSRERWEAQGKVAERHDWSAFGAATAFVDAVGAKAASKAIAAAAIQHKEQAMIRRTINDITTVDVIKGAVCIRQTVPGSSLSGGSAPEPEQIELEREDILKLIIVLQEAVAEPEEAAV